jgi:hypothetical protein
MNQGDISKPLLLAQFHIPSRRDRLVAISNAGRRIMLRLNELAGASLINDPYPHLVLEDALDRVQDLNTDFPPKERFGPTIRMHGDLTAGDPGYEDLISRSSAYGTLHRQVYSREFIRAFLELFRSPIQQAYQSGQLLLDPFALEIVPEPIELRVSGRSFVRGTAPFLYPRFDIGYAGVGYGINNGGRGVHVDNLPRLISILVFLNTPRSMVGGTHRLYGLRGSKPVLRKVYRSVSGLLIASLQSNLAFHDVEPIAEIEGDRRAFYIAVSCSEPIWKKEVHRKLSALNKNRYDPPPPSRITRQFQYLLSIFR